jgi:hypothetical protein
MNPNELEVKDYDVLFINEYGRITHMALFQPDTNMPTLESQPENGLVRLPEPIHVESKEELEQYMMNWYYNFDTHMITMQTNNNFSCESSVRIDPGNAIDGAPAVGIMEGSTEEIVLDEQPVDPGLIYLEHLRFKCPNDEVFVVGNLEWHVDMRVDVEPEKALDQVTIDLDAQTCTITGSHEGVNVTLDHPHRLTQTVLVDFGDDNG